MFIEFNKYFNITFSDHPNESSEAFDIFQNRYQGMSLGDGIYRIFRRNEISKWKQIITEGYPDFANKFEPFAYDWLGRCFAIDSREFTYGEILMFEIGTADVLQIPCDFIGFHEEEIPLQHDACLASDFFNDWRKIIGVDLEYDQCVGYRIPLFLGGKDSIENLEVSDMEVYWHICSLAKNK